MRTLMLGSWLLCVVSGCGTKTVMVKDASQSSPVVARPAPAAALVATSPAEPAAAEAGTWIGVAAPNALLPRQSEHTLAVWVDVPKGSAKSRVPAAVALAIDTSGSMGSQNKIIHARAAAQRLVDQLADGDIVSIQTFSDDVRVRVPATELRPETRRAIHSVIEELDARGGTNLFDGVRGAEAFAASADADHPVRRVVVISDGKATVGPTMPDAIGLLAETGARQGVQVTSFGVGLDYDEATLNTLAVRSSGRLYHIADASELGGIVERELSFIQNTTATQASIELVPAPGVSLLAAEGVQTSWGPNRSFSVPLGSLFAGQVRELVLRVRVDSTANGERPLVSARLHYSDPADGGVERIQESLARAGFGEVAEHADTHANLRAQSIILMHQAALLASQASLQANTGDFGSAERQLKLAEEQLRNGAVRAKDSAERDRLLSSASRMSTAQRSIKAASAAPAAKRATLGRASALDVNDAAMDMKGY